MPTPLTIIRTGIALAAIAGLGVLAGCALFGPSEDDRAQADLLMQAMDGYESWETVDGFDEWEQGTSVHGKVVRYFVNGVAYDNMAELPYGSIIVKEGYTRDRKLKAVTVMQRIEGYDPDNYDWFWARYDASGALTDAGKVGFCIDCHRDGTEGDFSFANAGF